MRTAPSAFTITKHRNVIVSAHVDGFCASALGRERRRFVDRDAPIHIGSKAIACLEWRIRKNAQAGRTFSVSGAQRTTVGKSIARRHDVSDTRIGISTRVHIAQCAHVNDSVTAATRFYCLVTAENQHHQPKNGQEKPFRHVTPSSRNRLRLHCNTLQFHVMRLQASFLGYLQPRFHVRESLMPPRTNPTLNYAITAGKE